MPADDAEEANSEYSDELSVLLRILITFREPVERDQ